MRVKDFLQLLYKEDKDRVEVQYKDGLYAMEYQKHLDNEEVMNAEIRNIRFEYEDGYFNCWVYTNE